MTDIGNLTLIPEQERKTIDEVLKKKCWDNPNFLTLYEGPNAIYGIHRSLVEQYKLGQEISKEEIDSLGLGNPFKVCRDGEKPVKIYVGSET